MGNTNRLGFKESPEDCIKKSLRQLGKKRKPFTEEHRKNISEAAKRRKKSGI
jgi:hypothetical protein